MTQTIRFYLPRLSNAALLELHESATKFMHAAPQLFVWLKELASDEIHRRCSKAKVPEETALPEWRGEFSDRDDALTALMFSDFAFAHTDDDLLRQFMGGVADAVQATVADYLETT